ncbi:MAG: hypothetical protein VYB65_08660 [Myxococcota bacterium]|nr:hypothetical protein [Myxococcota bacterium]
MDHRAVVPQLVRGLYEGGAGADEATLGDALEFSDPLVRVQGRARVLRMFRRLSALFPATQVALTELDELGDGWSRWSVTVRYARRVGAKPVVFRSTLHVISEGARIQSLTEHWRKPYPLNGGRRGLLPRWLRQAAGRVVSLRNLSAPFDEF